MSGPASSRAGSLPQGIAFQCGSEPAREGRDSVFRLTRESPPPHQSPSATAAAPVPTPPARWKSGIRL
ncbi:hypothetical protein FE275_11135 [Pseudomonas koreensis]|nr:hypothetical protein FE275_11135 [Pseudomonas koreensis]